jgi:hypothetical protein
LRYTDALFFWTKMAAPHRAKMAPATDASQNGSAMHSIQRRVAARLLCKNVGGVALASPVFSAMYPDATFIALVRNGFALCEGYTRRGRSAAHAGKMFETVCQQMLQDAKRIPNYHIVRFEDMVSDPVAVLTEIYRHAGLDISRVTKFRLQVQESTGKDGRRSFAFGATDRETRWFSLAELGNCFRRDVNENQIARLGEQDKRIFLQHAERSMEQLGYL